MEGVLDTQKQYRESISFPDVLSIRNVSDLHTKISDVFRNNNEIIFEIPASAEADLSFVQLVESARRQAKTEGKSLRLSSPVGERVLKVLERAGLAETFTADDARFWLHKEVTA
jgi:MFS superfamily sulfate permease-like transporter